MRVQCKHKVKRWAVLRLFFLLAAGIYPAFSQVPTQAKQLVLAIAPEWTSPKATLQCWQRDSAGTAWEPAFAEGWPVNLGRKGLAWGRGVFSPPSEEKIAWKTEKDGKAPAGIFE